MFDKIASLFLGPKVVEYGSKRLTAFIVAFVGNISLVLANAGLHLEIDPVQLSAFITASFLAVLKYINDETKKPSVKKK